MSRKLILPNEFIAVAEEQLRQGKSVKLLADGASMFPFIRGGKDVAEIFPLAKEDSMHLWNAYLFKNQGKYVIHRFIEEKQGKLTMMGDGNIGKIETIKREDVVGILKNIYTPDGKIKNCCSKYWQRKGRIWHSMLPMRRYLLALYRRLYKYGIMK